VPTDVGPSRSALGHPRGTPRAAAAARPREQGLLVWRRAIELADPLAKHDRFALTLDLLRAVRHDPATMAHASTLGRTHLRAHADDAAARSGVRILEASTAFLGVNPSRGELAGRGQR
jgi:hypothetical protein